jgi:dTDP-4-amino-4,6-dideoxygalactose transaminase
MSGRELEYVQEAFASNYIAPAGPALAQFETDFAAYTGIPYVVALSSGTAALHLAQRRLAIEPGREIWASDLTFIGSVVSVVHDRLTPVFIDCDAESWTLDPGLLGDALREANAKNALPAAVIPTDLYGQSCDLDAIVAACDEYGVPVICDSAEAVGTRYKGRHAGNGAWAAAFSFNGNKIITTSGGGMLATHDKKLADHARYLSQQARQPVMHYEHTEAGFNYRLSNISAAIGRGQLEVIETRVAQRRKVFETYAALLGDLPGVSFMPEASYGKTTRWLSVIQVDPEKFGCDREHIRERLEAENIEARPVWKPMHMQPLFKGARCVGGSLSARLYRDGLCLPSGSQLECSDIERISEILRAAHRR